MATEDVKNCREEKRWWVSHGLLQGKLWNSQTSPHHVAMLFWESPWDADISQPWSTTNLHGARLGPPPQMLLGLPETTSWSHILGVTYNYWQPNVRFDKQGSVQLESAWNFLDAYYYLHVPTMCLQCAYYVPTMCLQCAYMCLPLSTCAYLWLLHRITTCIGLLPATCAYIGLLLVPICDYIQVPIFAYMWF